MKIISIIILSFVSMISLAQNGNVDFKIGGLGDDMFARYEVSAFADDSAEFTFGGGFRFVDGNAGLMHSGAMSFSGLMHYNAKFIRFSAGPSLQVRNGETGLGGVLVYNLKKEIGTKASIISQITIEAGSLMVYGRGSVGVGFGKFSFVCGLETIHDGFFTEINYQPAKYVSIGLSRIEASGWAGEGGIRRQDGMALEARVKF